MSTVLLVQPDPELNDVWRVALESSGHAVVTTATVQRGVSHVREGGFDVVVIDHNGGGEPDLAVLVEGLQKLPDAPPLVLVSSSPDAPTISARVGAAAFLPKPCSPGDLDSVVTRVGGIPPGHQVEDEPTRPLPTPE